MRAIYLLLLIPLTLLLLSSTADAKSCATFAIVKSYDADASTITIDVKKGNSRKFFPKPEGAPNVSKIPKKCKSKILKQKTFPVTSRGGRLSISQVRENFMGKMLNDPDDPEWLGTKLKELIANKTKVVIVLRPPLAKNKKNIQAVSTIYMPITQPELDEIKRLEAQAVDED